MIFLKSDIVNQLAERFPYHKKKDLEEVTSIIMQSLVNSLKENDGIEVRGLGSFKIREQKIKEFLNPKTQKLSISNKSKKIFFRPSTEFDDL